MQSKAHHSGWENVLRDIGNHDEVSLRPGWRIVWSVPAEVLPDPASFVRKVLVVVVQQPGKRSRLLRRKWVDSRGVVVWPRRADLPAVVPGVEGV